MSKHERFFYYSFVGKDRTQSFNNKLCNLRLVYPVVLILSKFIFAEGKCKRFCPLIKSFLPFLGSKEPCQSLLILL